MQFCVCVSTIAKPKRFCEQSEQNVHPFAQSDAVGSAENYRVFFFFGSLFLFSSQQKRKSEHIKLHNLSILTIDAHNFGHVTNYLTCTAMTPFGILRGLNPEESHAKRDPSLTLRMTDNSVVTVPCVRMT